MTSGTTFNDILTAIAKGWCARKVDEPVFSLALPLKGIDPLCQLPLLGEKEKEANNISVRKHGGEDLGTMKLNDLIQRIKKEIQEY